MKSHRTIDGLSNHGRERHGNSPFVIASESMSQTFVVSVILPLFAVVRCCITRTPQAEDFPFLFGRTYEDVHRDRLALRLRQEKERREAAAVEASEKGYLSREERVEIAESLAKEATASAGRLLEKIETLDGEK
jgi:hypothetical protein